MSAFEQFIQVELPLRPFLPTDPAQEAVIVRRGPGPRQIEGVNITDGQVLGKVGGVVQGVNISSIANASYKHTQAALDNTWVITHNQGSTDWIVQTRDVNNNVMIPDSIRVGDAGGVGSNPTNTITVTFGDPQTGTAYIIFI